MHSDLNHSHRARARSSLCAIHGSRRGNESERHPLHLSDAPGDRARRAGQLSKMWHGVGAGNPAKPSRARRAGCHRCAPLSLSS